MREKKRACEDHKISMELLFKQRNSKSHTMTSVKIKCKKNIKSMEMKQCNISIIIVHYIAFPPSLWKSHSKCSSYENYRKNPYINYKFSLNSKKPYKHSESLSKYVAKWSKHNENWFLSIRQTVWVKSDAILRMNPMDKLQFSIKIVFGRTSWF